MGERRQEKKEEMDPGPVIAVRGSGEVGGNEEVDGSFGRADRPYLTSHDA
jgi:hypothetical protein